MDILWFVACVLLAVGAAVYLALPKRSLVTLEGAEYEPEVEEVDALVEAAIVRRPPLLKVAFSLPWLIGAGAALVAGIITGWWGAGILASGIVLYIPLMIADTKRTHDDLETASIVAAWADQVRSLVDAGVDRHQALGQAALNQDHPALGRFAAELDVHQPDLALRRLAQRIQHKQADYVIGVLLATEGETAGDLTGTLKRMTRHIRAEISMMEELIAKRAGIRMERNLTALLGFGLMLMVTLLGGLAQYYADFFGQVVIVGVGLFSAAGMWWMARLEKFKTPARFRLRGTRTQ